MVEKAKKSAERFKVLRAELEQMTKDDPERAKVMEAAIRVMEENEEVLRRLADS